MADAALHPHAAQTRIISTDGARALPERAITEAAAQGWAVVAAFDGDAAGEKLATRLQELCPGAIREQPPAGKDWAEALPGRAARRGRAARELPGRERR